MFSQAKRPRRLRLNPKIRALVRETDLEPRHLIAPFFVVEGAQVRRPIASMPGVFHLSADQVCKEARILADKGVGGILLFGVPSHKDERGSGAYAENGLVQQTLQRLAKEVPDVLRISDVCLCEYTTSGHCGLVENGQVVNDASLELLAKTALSHVKAGSEMVAPSDMMDHRVAVIRKVLDEHRYDGIPIMSYAVKYASAFYGPFREAAKSAPTVGDRRGYQMDPGNSREAWREAFLDVEEGADILMVKPAGYYLDVVAKLKQHFSLPLAAYQVSGEYAMIRAAAEKGYVSGEAAMLESIMAIRRAGADMVITYFTSDVLDVLGAS